MPSVLPPLGVMSCGPFASGSSMPASRAEKQVHEPEKIGPSPTRIRPNMPMGTCFSPTRKVLLVPSAMPGRLVLLLNVTSVVLAVVVEMLGVVLGRMIAPLLLTLNQLNWLALVFGG